MFMQSCVDAGPDVCPLYKPTAAEVHTRIKNIFTSLKHHPIPVRNGSTYGVVDYRTARLALFYYLYEPYKNSQAIAHALAAAERGDGLPLAAYNFPRFPPMRCDCQLPGQPTPPITSTPDTMAAILCADAAGQRLNDTVEDLEARFSAMAAMSEFAGAWPFGAWCKCVRARSTLLRS